MQRGDDDTRSVIYCDCYVQVVIYENMIYAFDIVLSGPLTNLLRG